MDKKTRVAIVVPNWNGASLISPCLESLLKQSNSADVIVVDNGSSDKSVNLIKHKYPSVTLIELPKNLGFAGGVNSGIRYALQKNYEFIALFNNDAVADSKWLKHLVISADKHKEAGIITGKLIETNTNKFDSAGEISVSYTHLTLPTIYS